jgi:hypothetical protein
MKRKIYLLSLLMIPGIISVYAQNIITVNPGENLITAIENAAAGDIIIVAPGIHVARYENIDINKSLTIKSDIPQPQKSGATGSDKPLVYINQFDIQGTDVNLFFEGIEFSGATVDSLTGEEDLETLDGDYFINLHEALVSCGDITVKDCIIRNLNRSVIRGDRATYTVNNILIDDCIITDLRGGGDYGPFRFKSKILFDNFTITNCTFYNILNKLIDNQDTPSHPMEFLIRNCTFYKWGGGKSGNYLFDIEDNDQAVLKIQDCIFGKTNDDPFATTPVTVNGFRLLEAAYAEMITTVMTPDFVLTLGTYAEIPWDLSQYNEVDMDPDWANPEEGDFTLPEESPLLEMSQTGEIIGDPRWDPNAVGIDKSHGRSAFRIFPNPAFDYFLVELDHSVNKADISIYNALGMRVLEYQNVRNNTHLDISGLASGVYFVRLDKDFGPALKLMVR